MPNRSARLICFSTSAMCSLSILDICSAVMVAGAGAGVAALAVGALGVGSGSAEAEDDAADAAFLTGLFLAGEVAAAGASAASSSGASSTASSTSSAASSSKSPKSSTSNANSKRSTNSAFLPLVSNPRDFSSCLSSETFNSLGSTSDIFVGGCVINKKKGKLKLHRISGGGI